VFSVCLDTANVLRSQRWQRPDSGYSAEEDGKVTTIDSRAGVDGN
jgi:hypothetical protein